MRLALEALGVAQPQPTIVDTLIDQLKLIDTEDALRDSLEEMDVLIHTYQSLESIHQAIKTCGVTQSIVHLYGENFSSMESDQPGDAEKEVEEKKQGLLARIWTAIKNMFEKFIEWVKGLTTNIERIKEQLGLIEDKANSCKYPLEVTGLLTGDLMKKMRDHTDTFDMFEWRKNTTEGIRARDEFLKRVEKAISTEHKDVLKTSQELISLSRDYHKHLSDISNYQQVFERELNRISNTKDESVTGESVEYTRHRLLVCKKCLDAIVISSRRLISTVNKAQK